MSDKSDKHATLISELKKAGLHNYKEALAAGELEETTVKLYIPTGIVPVDHILGGGFPVGRISEIYGPEAVFKTGLSSMAMECAMYMGGVGIYYDNEESFDENRSRLPQSETFIYGINDSLEDFFVSLKRNLKVVTAQDAVSLVLWDSMPATLPKLILESDEGDRTLAESARIIAIEIPRCKHLIRESLCAFVMVNQIRDNIKDSGGGPLPRYPVFSDLYHTPGGRAPKFFATLRVQLTKKGKFTWYSDSTETNGVYIELLVEKNKNFDPFRKVRFPIIYRDDRGGDPAMAYYDWAIEQPEIPPGGGGGKYDFSNVVPNLKIHRVEFHDAYREHLDAFLDFYTSKTTFRYGELAKIGVKMLTQALYSKSTPVTRNESTRKKPR
jgi:recombination protein RecA